MPIELADAISEYIEIFPRPPTTPLQHHRAARQGVIDATSSPITTFTAVMSVVRDIPGPAVIRACGTPSAADF